MKKLFDWLDDRSGYRKALEVALVEPVAGGASLAYVLGSVLVFLLLLQMTTGVFLAMYYSPSATDAWGSVAYIQDQVSLGWFVRGLHSYGASAMVLVAGCHLLQTALYGAYKKPRELNWIVGVLMLGLILAFALTGYLLPWDQKGFWATKVATGIAGTTPMVGAQVQHAVQGGNEYGNLTLTRFFSIHVFILPAALLLLTAVHLTLFRRYGVTPHWWLKKKQLEERVDPFWPDQLFRDLIVMALVFAALVTINLYAHGTGLGAPADPASNFDARPEWYFRPLYQALKYFHGTAERVVALGAPVLLGGVLLWMPFADRRPSRRPLRRWPYLAPLGILVAAAIALTVVSFREDAADAELQKSWARSEKQAARARELAARYGVPPEGGRAVFGVAPEPFGGAEKIWKKECVPCHQGDDRRGPLLGGGYNSRAWIRAFLKQPNSDPFYGRTQITDMVPAELEGEELSAVVELLYKQTGAGDVDEKLAEHGAELFQDSSCGGCHPSIGDYDAEASVGPNLTDRGSVKMLAEYIGRPSHPRWYGDRSEMPDFYNRYDLQERTQLARYLLSLQKQAPPSH